MEKNYKLDERAMQILFNTFEIKNSDIEELCFSIRCAARSDAPIKFKDILDVKVRKRRSLKDVSLTDAS